MYAHLESWVFADESAGGASVIEVNVGQENQTQIGDAKSEFFKARPQSGDR